MKGTFPRSKFCLITVIVLLAGFLLIGCRQEEEAPPEGEITDIAITFVEELEMEDYEGAVSRFNREMHQGMPKELLGQTWRQLEGQVGPFKEIITTREERIQEYDVIFVTTEFENADIDIRVVFDEEKWIAGLFFEPAAEASGDGEMPDYVDPGAFLEEEVIFGADPWRISGTLTIPEGEGPYPAVVLVHGSGPNDRNSTVGPNRPLKDIAEGLSSSGIAVLRYDKRTYTYQAALGEIMGGFTVREETMDDALEAVAFLRGHDMVDPEQIYLAGHSLGGMLAPRIAEETDALKGLILLAAPGRSLDELILEQSEYLTEHEEDHREEVEMELEELRRQIERIQDPNLDPDTPPEGTLGVPADYWLDLQQYDAVETAKMLDIPMLILQGERDYQVTMEDFALWQKALSNEPGISFRSYSDLNHLFMYGEGLSFPDEYFEPGHVEEEVISDILRWILDRSE